MMMIRAGDPVDQQINALLPFLEAGDIGKRTKLEFFFFFFVKSGILRMWLSAAVQQTRSFSFSPFSF